MKKFLNKIKSLIKEIIFGLLNLANPRNRRLFILTYHSVGNNPVFFTVNKDNFLWQMNYLKRHDYKAVFLSEAVELLKHNQLREKCVVITFDDGYKDFYKNAFPILKNLGFKTTLFVSTDYINNEMNNSSNHPLAIMSLEELKELNQSGLVEIEPHSKTHLKLTKISLEEARTEILDSKIEIETIFKKTCRSFAYPKGCYNEILADLIKNIGFDAAVTVEEGGNDYGAHLFKLKRNSVDSMTGKKQFIGKINGSIDLFNKMFRWCPLIF